MNFIGLLRFLVKDSTLACTVPQYKFDKYFKAVDADIQTTHMVSYCFLSNNNICKLILSQKTCVCVYITNPPPKKHSNYLQHSTAVNA